MTEERAKWIADRQAAMGTAGTPDAVVLPSKLIDQGKLVLLKQKGVHLETSRGGQTLGALVHEVLAVIPLDREDLAEDYVRYFASRRGVRKSLAARAVGLVRAALRSDVIQTARNSRHWREVPFSMAGPNGIVEGTIDLVFEDAGTITVVDFKTDAAGPELEAELQAIYAPQLESYVAALSGSGVKKVVSRLLLLS